MAQQVTVSLQFFPTCDHRLDVRSGLMPCGGQIDVCNKENQHHESPGRMHERHDFETQIGIYTPDFPIGVEKVEQA